MKNDYLQEHGLRKAIAMRHEEIQKVYLNDKRPWVIGYSGGKDSTTTVQLVINAINELPKEKRIKKVYIVSSNTLVENPLIDQFVMKQHRLINSYANINELPIKAVIVTPLITDTFWTLLIGKGYPSPRQKFRWCTDRLKINPIDRFIAEKIDQFGEVIVVLGVRRQESSSRAGTIDKHTIEGKILKKHTTTNNAYVYAPIEMFSLDDVWTYLMQVESPWGADNLDLLALYNDATDASDCPLQVDKDAPSCGNSRFGCWCCTVVQKDKSLTGFIKNGHKELMPLLKVRNKIAEMRDLPENRMNRRMNGSIYILNTKEGPKRGLGPYTLEARKEMLRELLKAENVYLKRVIIEPKTPIISTEEVKQIQKYWTAIGDWENQAIEIYEEIKGIRIEIPKSAQSAFTKKEVHLLEEVAQNENLSPELLKKLISLEQEFYGLKSRKGVMDKLGSVLRQDWIHEEIVMEQLITAKEDVDLHETEEDYAQ